MAIRIPTQGASLQEAYLANFRGRVGVAARTQGEQELRADEAGAATYANGAEAYDAQADRGPRRVARGSQSSDPRLERFASAEEDREPRSVAIEAYRSVERNTVYDAPGGELVGIDIFV